AALPAANQPVPTPISIRALVDTAASCTRVHPSDFTSLQPTPTGSAQMHTPSTRTAPAVPDQHDVALATFAAANQAPLILPAVPEAKPDGASNQVERNPLGLRCR